MPGARDPSTASLKSSMILSHGGIISLWRKGYISIILRPFLKLKFSYHFDRNDIFFVVCLRQSAENIYPRLVSDGVPPSFGFLRAKLLSFILTLIIFIICLQFFYFQKGLDQLTIKGADRINSSGH